MLQMKICILVKISIETTAVTTENKGLYIKCIIIRDIAQSAISMVLRNKKIDITNKQPDLIKNL